MTAEDRAHLIEYVYNDIASLEAAVASAGDDLAASSPRPSATTTDSIRNCRTPNSPGARASSVTTSGAALILDDVRAGFRLTLRGSWDLVGVQPDLSAWSKAIANGYALSAVTGNDQLARRRVALVRHRLVLVRRVSMAAAVATLDELERIDGPRVLRRLGPALPRRDRGTGREGWRRGAAERAAANADHPVRRRR